MFLHFWPVPVSKPAMFKLGEYENGRVFYTDLIMEVQRLELPAVS